MSIPYINTVCLHLLKIGHHLGAEGCEDDKPWPLSHTWEKRTYREGSRVLSAVLGMPHEHRAESSWLPLMDQRESFRGLGFFSLRRPYIPASETNANNLVLGLKEEGS